MSEQEQMIEAAREYEKLLSRNGMPGASEMVRELLSIISQQAEEIERLKKCMTDVRQIEVDEFGETIVSKMIDECLEENPHVNP